MGAAASLFLPGHDGDAVRAAASADDHVEEVGLPGGMNGRQLADAARVLRPDLEVSFITG